MVSRRCVCTRIAASTYAKKNIQICPYIAYCYPLKKLARLPDISAKMSSIIILQWMQQKKSHQKKLDFYNSFEHWKKWAMSLFYLALHFLLFNTNWQPKKISTCLYRSILLWLKKTDWHKCDFFCSFFGVRLFQVLSIVENGLHSGNIYCGMRICTIVWCLHFQKKYVYVRQSFTKACSVYLNNNAKNLPKNKWNMLYTFTQVKKKNEEISELQKNDKVKDLKIAATNFSTRYR